MPSHHTLKICWLCADHPQMYAVYPKNYPTCCKTSLSTESSTPPRGANCSNWKGMPSISAGLIPFRRNRRLHIPRHCARVFYFPSRGNFLFRSSFAPFFSHHATTPSPARILSVVLNMPRGSAPRFVRTTRRQHHGMTTCCYVGLCPQICPFYRRLAVVHE